MERRVRMQSVINRIINWLLGGSLERLVEAVAGGDGGERD